VTERLIEGPAGVPIVLLGPQEREQSVTAMEAPGTGDGEVGEESDALRLCQDGTDVHAGGVQQGERSEGAELDHVSKMGPRPQ
jgi:hypothetical protein